MAKFRKKIGIRRFFIFIIALIQIVKYALVLWGYFILYNLMNRTNEVTATQGQAEERRAIEV